ncbi:neuroparsin-A-like [Scylla paramamosain]|nr:neuroparsin 2 [Scylla paramamosain]
MEMTTRSYIFFFIVSSTALLLLLPGRCEGGPICSSLNEVLPEMLQAPCRHGVVMDWCGNARCAKGPGETCGGRWNVKGSCGKGMYCVCGYCAGCSWDLQCALGRFC